jgi:hypothetical protein
MYLRNAFTTSSQLRKMANKYGIPLTAIIHKDNLMHLHPKCGQSYIINMENSNGSQGGTHWVSLILDKDDNNKVAAYMDSFAFPPPCDVINFCKRYTDIPVMYSDKQIQSIRSGFCGQYCTLFLKIMYSCKGSLKKRYQKFIDVFICK